MPSKVNKVTERVDAITIVPDDVLSATPPVPKAVKIELTARCNFKCAFCATAAKLRQQGEMDKEFYKRITKEMARDGVQELGMFFLGESFLCDWLPWAIEWAKQECGFEYVFITTNGRLTTVDKVDACMNAGLDSLKWSMNSANSEQFASITGTPANGFDVVLKNLKDAYLLREAKGYKCGLYASSIRYNDKQLEDMKKLVKEILPYIDEHYWLPLYSQAGLTGKKMEAIGHKPVKGNFGRWGVSTGRNQNYCFALFTEARITYDGKMSGCCFNHNHEFDMGDLTEVSFMDAWHSTKYQSLRNAMLSGDMVDTQCEECWTCTYV